MKKITAALATIALGAMLATGSATMSMAHGGGGGHGGGFGGGGFGGGGHSASMGGGGHFGGFGGGHFGGGGFGGEHGVGIAGGGRIAGLGGEAHVHGVHVRDGHRFRRGRGFGSDYYDDGYCGYPYPYPYEGYLGLYPYCP